MRAGRGSWFVCVFVFFCLFSSLATEVAAQVTPAKYFRTSTLPYLRSLDGETVCMESIRRYRATLSASAAALPWTYYGPTVPYATATSGGCYYRLPPDTGLNNNGSWVKLTCTTATPYFDPAVGCVASEPPPPPPVCKAGEEGGGHWYRGPVAGPTPDFPFKGASDGNCEIDMFDVVQCYKATDGNAYCEYRYRKTGVAKPAGPANSPTAGPVAPLPTQAPNGRTDVPPQASPGGCPTGTVQAGVSSDGVPICMGTGSAPRNPAPPPPKTEATKTEAMPDGSTKTTTTVTTSNSDGSKTTHTTVTITQTDGTKTIEGTKSTTLNPAGGAGKDESAKDDEKFDLCKQNPMLTICRNSSVAGTCGTITCTGDAIQCATLRSVAAMECREVDELAKLEALPSSALGKSILGGTDPMQGAIDGALKGTEVDLSQASLSDAAFLSSAVCLADRSFTVGGRTITVSFARLCPALLPLRYAVLACAWIVAYLIVSRSILNG